MSSYGMSDYSEIVLDHFYQPRNCSVLGNPDAIGVAGEPGQGNFMVLYLRVGAGRISEATFQTHGCCPSIAAGSLLTEGDDPGRDRVPLQRRRERPAAV